MPDDNPTLATFYEQWQRYQQHIVDAVAPLTDAQLALRPAPSLRSIGEIALHIVGGRMFWFAEVMGEDGGEALQPFASWNQAALTPNPPIPPATEIVQGLDRTWQFLADRLARWTPDDMHRTFPDEPEDISRAWIVWHVLEHDLHHGGELSLTLGVHGIPANFPG